MPVGVAVVGPEHMLHRMLCMTRIGSRALRGALAGIVGVVVTRVVRRRTESFVRERRPRPTDVFESARSLSPLGLHHRRGESPAEAIARIGYTKVVGHEPSAKLDRSLAQVLRIVLGIAAGVVLARSARSVVRAGAGTGLAIWLLVDELALPALGLADRPTAYHPTHHARLLAERLSFGVTSALTNRAMEVV